MRSGSQIGPYTIDAELGSGGMGKVYRATDFAGNTVALKVLHPHLVASPGFFKWFLREAEVGKRVVHPGVVRVHEVDATLVDDRQLNFLVMEYVEGQTLRSLLDELGRVPEELCIHIGCELTRALAAIHAAGAVHRDIKPENVLITDDYVVKLMDLGMARLMDEAVRLSQTGQFVGTVLYAAPEQFTGEEVDARTDLYGLGLVLYELSTGRHPFAADHAHAVIQRLISEEARSAAAVNPQLSPFFEEFVNVLLAKDRAKRFASADAAREVLEQGEQSPWWQERAAALQAETKRPLRRIRIPRETALYGREQELERLRNLYEPVKQGQGRVVCIEGEAGIGKTRLVDEFVATLLADGEEPNFLFGGYPPGGAATAAGAFSTAYREHLGSANIDETLREYLADTPLLVPAFSAMLRGEGLPSDQEPLPKDSLQTCFVNTTRRLARERPTIVMVDDLHFAPDGGRALFAALALAVPEHRVLLIGTARGNELTDWLASIDRLDHATRLTLARLSPKVLARLLVEAFQSERLAEDLSFQIATKSDGNPYFTFEIIRALREDELIRREQDGSWIQTSAIREIKIPSSVREMVQVRMAGIVDEDRELLEVASCCGFRFDPLLVAEATGMERVPALKRFGRIEKTHGVIRAEGRGYVFDHYQVQEAFYEGLLPPLAEHYHAQLARVLETRLGSNTPDGDRALELCEHLVKGDGQDRVHRYLDRALDHLEGSYLPDAAAELSQRVLAAEGLYEGAERVALLLRQGTSLQRLGRADAGRGALREAVELADQTDDVALRALTRRELGRVCVDSTRFEEGGKLLNEAREMATEIGDRGLETKCLRSLGVASDLMGHYKEGEEYFRRDLAICEELGDRSGESTAVGNLGVALYYQGRYDESSACLEQHLKLTRELGKRIGEMRATGNLGAIYRVRGRLAATLAQYRRHLEMSREMGHRASEATARSNVANTLYELGALEEARLHHGRYAALAREISSRTDEGLAVQLEGLLEEAEGDLAHAASLLERSITLFREAGNPRSVATATSDLGETEMRRGNIEESARRFDEVLELAREHDQGGILLTAASLRACLPGGDVAAALETLAEQEPRAGHMERMAARFRLWQASRDATHLEEAHRLLTFARDHAPEEYRDSMIENVLLHREITKAWDEHGGDA